MKYFFILSSLFFLMSFHAEKSYGIPNPASENCVNLGGASILLNNESESYGACLLGNEMIDEHTLYRCTDQLEESVAVEKYLSRLKTIKNDTDNRLIYSLPDYCAEFSARAVYLRDNLSNKEYQFCKFNDGSAIELWTLVWGGSEDILTPLTAKLQACKR